MTRARGESLKTVLILALVLLLAPRALGAQSAPAGWRFPTEADYSGDWQEFRHVTPVPFHVRGDFDGNGVTDDAWLLMRTKVRGWGLFVFLRRRGGRARVVKLEAYPNNAQEVGISLARPGNIKTACGKGYIGACEPGVPEVLRLRRPGVNLFHHEKSNTVHYWDERARRFKSVYTSD